MNEVASGIREVGRRARAMLGVAVVIGVCCWLSIRYTRQPGGFSALWAASGLLCGILLTAPRREWRALFVAAFAGNLAAHFLAQDAWYPSIALSLAGIIESALVAFGIARFVDDVTDTAQIKLTAAVAT